MSNRGVAWGASTTVVLAAVNSAVINELHGGWPWWTAASVVTLVAAGLAAWIAARSSGGENSLLVEGGGVYAGRDIAGRVRTGHQPPEVPTSHQQGARLIGRGAVAAGRDILRSADIDTTGGRTSADSGR